MKTANRNRAFFGATVSAMGLLMFACGSKSNLKARPPADGAAPNSPGGGNSGVGGALGSGGILSSGGVSGTAGASGSGGAKSVDASVRLACSDDGGRGFPWAARGCSQDEDCTFLIQEDCCAPGQAFGVAKAHASDYSTECIEQLDCDPQCGRSYGYLTDTGRTTPAGSAGAAPFGSLVVRCVDQLCTTDVVDAVDAGQDAAVVDTPAADVGAELAGQPCGDAACNPGQACILKGGGPVPPCDPPSDAGTCPDWLVLVASCGGSGPPYRQPGCTTPPPSPRCYDVPGACEDLCSCVCGLSFGFGCNPGPGYYFCSYP
jgi:hypothetical protein